MYMLATPDHSRSSQGFAILQSVCDALDKVAVPLVQFYTVLISMRGHPWWLWDGF